MLARQEFQLAERKATLPIGNLAVLSRGVVRTDVAAFAHRAGIAL